MNKKIKLLIAACTLALFCLLLVSCSNKNVYDDYDNAGYNVTVKYDANGGYFKDTLNVGLTDTYDISNSKTNENGMVEIMLYPPDSDQRGSAENKFPATRGDGEYYLVGWFTKKTEVVDQDGNVSYKYSGKWDFSKPLEIDPSKQYSADEPVVTLHAVWNEKTEDNYHKIEVYDIDNPDSLLAEYVYGSGYEPTVDKSKEVKLPFWNEATGTLSYGVFDSIDSVKIDGKTLDSVYLDKDEKNKLEGETYMHPVTINNEGKLENRVLKLYFKYREGNWYKIYNAKQLNKINDPTANYELMADLDFSKTAWPSSFTTKTFTGKIIGNGYTIKNINIKSEGKNRFGLFAVISKDAVIDNVKFSDINATLENGVRTPGGRYALFASIIEEGFVFKNVTIENATLTVVANARDSIKTQDYEVALLCAEGYHVGLGIDISGIKFGVKETDYDTFKLTIEVDADENRLLLDFDEIIVE